MLTWIERLSVWSKNVPRIDTFDNREEMSSTEKSNMVMSELFNIDWLVVRLIHWLTDCSENGLLRMGRWSKLIACVHWCRDTRTVPNIWLVDWLMNTMTDLKSNWLIDPRPIIDVQRIQIDWLNDWLIKLIEWLNGRLYQATTDWLTGLILLIDWHDSLIHWLISLCWIGWLWVESTKTNAVMDWMIDWL